MSLGRQERLKQKNQADRETPQGILLQLSVEQRSMDIAADLEPMYISILRLVRL